MKGGSIEQENYKMCSQMFQVSSANLGLVWRNQLPAMGLGCYCNAGRGCRENDSLGFRVSKNHAERGLSLHPGFARDCLIRDAARDLKKIVG